MPPVVVYYLAMASLVSETSGMYLLVGAMIAMAATVASALGFGFNLLAAPLLVSLYDPKHIIPSLHMAWVPIGVVLLIHHRRHVKPSRIGWWLILAIPGLVAGVWMLDLLDRDVMRRMVGTVTVVCALLLACRQRYPIKDERLWMMGAGGLSGLLGGSTSMSGPPIVLLGLNQKWDTVPFRADLLGYFTCLSAVCIVLLGWRGMLSAQSVDYAVAGAPGLVVGYLVGTTLARYVVGKGFRYAALGLLFAAGITPWLHPS